MILIFRRPFFPAQAIAPGSSVRLAWFVADGTSGGGPVRTVVEWLPIWRRRGRR
jgi:hypothetical protein